MRPFSAAAQLAFGFALGFGLLSDAAFHAATAAEAPSFDCRTAKRAREVAICQSDRLARADRAIATAYAAAKARLGATARARLIEDQRRFVEGLDDGFDRGLWNKAEPTDIRQTVRSAIAEGHDSVKSLGTLMEARARMLQAARPAAPGEWAGVWSADDTTLTLKPVGAGRYEMRFAWAIYNFPRDHCGFKALFARDGATLVSTEQEGDDDYAPGEGNLVLSIEDGMLKLANTAEERRTCGRDAALQRVLFKHDGR